MSGFLFLASLQGYGYVGHVSYFKGKQYTKTYAQDLVKLHLDNILRSYGYTHYVPFYSNLVVGFSTDGYEYSYEKSAPYYSLPVGYYSSNSYDAIKYVEVHRLYSTIDISPIFNHTVFEKSYNNDIFSYALIFDDLHIYGEDDFTFTKCIIIVFS